jgi:hypothetical protein
MMFLIMMLKLVSENTLNDYNFTLSLAARLELSYIVEAYYICKTYYNINAVESVYKRVLFNFD